LERPFRALAEVGARAAFGEALHARGLNLARLRAAGVPAAVGPSVGGEVGRAFEALLRQFGPQGAYWRERPPSSREERPPAFPRRTEEIQARAGPDFAV